MTQLEFEEILADIHAQSKAVLTRKREEYADDYDVLQNFKRAASLKGETPAQALVGMMAKHTISVYDMVAKGDPTQFTEAQWDEKIIDHSNYLILLKAVVRDALDNPKD